MAFTSFPSSPFLKFIRKRSGPFDGEVVLDSSRVYILPTRTGIMFGVLLLLLLVGSVNYEKSLGYALTFLLVGIGNIAILSTWKNLKGLVVSDAGCAPVFAGDIAKFRIRCFNPDGSSRHSISLFHDQSEHSVTDIEPDGSAGMSFDVATSSRGKCKAGPIKLSTEFPFGLFVAWTWVDLNRDALVYPRPSEQLPEIFNDASDAGEDETAGAGQEVFDGLRSYQPGESYRRVSWKSFARNNELMTKHYSGGATVERWIDWSNIAVDDTEEKLSVMCRLVLESDERGATYGLRLPGTSIDPDSGKPHRHRCLRALALYGIDDAI